MPMTHETQLLIVEIDGGSRRIVDRSEYENARVTNLATFTPTGRPINTPIARSEITRPIGELRDPHTPRTR